MLEKMNLSAIPLSITTKVQVYSLQHYIYLFIDVPLLPIANLVKTPSKTKKTHFVHIKNAFSIYRRLLGGVVPTPVPMMFCDHLPFHFCVTKPLSTIYVHLFDGFCTAASASGFTAKTLK